MKKILLLIGWMSYFQGVHGSVLERDEGFSNKFLSDEDLFKKGIPSKDIAQARKYQKEWETELIEVNFPLVQKMLMKAKQELQAIEASFPFLVESLNPIYRKMETIKRQKFQFLNDLDQGLYPLELQIFEVAKALETAMQIQENSHDQTASVLDDFQRDLSPVEPFCDPVKVLKERILNLSQAKAKLSESQIGLEKGRGDFRVLMEEKNERLLKALVKGREANERAIAAILEERKNCDARKGQEGKLDALDSAILDQAKSDLEALKGAEGRLFNEDFMALDIAELKAQREELIKILEEEEKLLDLDAKSSISDAIDFEAELKNYEEAADNLDSQEKSDRFSKSKIETIKKTRSGWEEWKADAEQTIEWLKLQITNFETILGDRISHGFSAVEARCENERETERSKSKKLRRKSESVRMESERIRADSDRIRVECEKAKKEGIVASMNYKKTEEEIFTRPSLAEGRL